MAPDPEPHTDWARHALRINDLIDSQVRSLRKRQVIGSFESRDHLEDVSGKFAARKIAPHPTTFFIGLLLPSRYPL